MRCFARTIHTPTIWIRTRPIDKNWVAIAIADNGPGMTKEIGSRLFDPFFTTKPIGEGTGLSLTKKGVQKFRRRAST